MKKYLILFLLLVIILCSVNNIVENYQNNYNTSNNSLTKIIKKNNTNLYFYTFCVNIGKYTEYDLTKVLKLLLTSIDKHINDYKIICFTNFDVEGNLDKIYNLEYREYYDNYKQKLYNDKWLNLSFNKINIYKDLHNEFDEDFIWIDLDTIITYNISYIKNLSNCFIENGGLNINKNQLFRNNSSITIPRNKYILGNFWKLNINLYHELMNTFNELQKQNLVLRYDLQDLFSYHIYIKNKGKLKNIYILGNNVKKNTINGLGVWSLEGNTHANIDGLNKLYYNNNNILKTTLYKDKEIHILSFTFNSLKQLYNNPKFISLF